MSLKDLTFRHSYSVGVGKDITNDFLIPALNESESYKRSVGYFSCNSLLHLSKGINGLVENDGKLQVITSPNLTEDDLELLDAAYDERLKQLTEIIARQIKNETINVKLKTLDDIKTMIKHNILEIKIVMRKDLGLFHDKVGILSDSSNNKVCFVGSVNETFAGYTANYEKIRVFTNWSSEADHERIEDEENEFDQIWEGTHDSIETYDFPEALKWKVIKKIDDNRHIILEDKESHEGPTYQEEPVTLRDYQKEAKEAWKVHGFNGFYEMATGTGKTWTALFSVKDLLEQDPTVTIIIVAPYKHLIEQWYTDVVKLYQDIDMVRVSSDFPGWEDKLRAKINLNRYSDSQKPLIVLVTQSSFGLTRFRKLIKRVSTTKLLLVDEAHRFYNLTKKKDLSFDYKLGLSATPHFNNREKTRELVDYFGGVVFKYTLEDALGKHLVHYNYIPFYVHLTHEEEVRFKKVQGQIASSFRGGKLIKDVDTLTKYLRRRNAILARAEEKEEKRLQFINRIQDHSHLIVYCGDGIVNVDGKEGGLRYIDQVTRELHENDFRVHKFTSTETLKERIEMIEDFTHEKIDVLAAIRCLDEGVNIPAIKSALILASNNDTREFIQRRGRILRKFEGKDIANIYDVIVLPNDSNYKAVAQYELKRYYEYARLAQNQADLMNKLDELMFQYDLDMEDLHVEEYDVDDRSELYDD